MPSRSISARQDALLDTGFLDILGISKSSQPVSFDYFESALATLALEIAERGKKNLQKADRVASGKLEDSIIPTRVSIFGQVYEVTINLESYYDFVNQGVKGWKSSDKAPQSPYQFKDGRVSKKMMTEIRKWVIKEGLKGKGKENRHKKASMRDRRRASITETSQRVAYAISSAIKAKGLKASHFWDDTLKEMEPIIEDRLDKALKIAITQNLTQ